MQSVALKIIKVKSPEEKAKILAEFNPENSTWVVPDLVSRSAIQKRFLDECGFAEANACVRVSDLWQHLLFSVRSDVRVISPALAKALIREWLTESEFDWAKTPGASETVVQYLTELIPLLSHPDSQNLMPKWFQDNQGAFVRWGLWYLESMRLWKKFSTEKLIARNWISGVLVNEPGFEKSWSRPIVFDLGVEVLAPEMELIKALGRFQDVTLILPSPEWGPELSQTQNWLGSGIDYRRFASGLAEIKDAVATVRWWTDAGVEFEKIAVLAPNRKRIWSTLAEFLKHEGVPVRETESDPMSAHGRVAQLLARLELGNSKLTSDKLEMDLFHSATARKIILNYNDFSRIFSYVYDQNDVRRHSGIAKSYESKAADEKKNANGFLKDVSALWDENWNSEPIEKIFGEVLKDVPGNIQLEKNNWIGYLGDLTRTIDLPEEKSAQEGIYIENYISAEHLPVSHIYFLNATDAEFRKSRRTSILDEDLKSLSRSLGFNLVVNDPNAPEYNAKWILSKNHLKSVLSYSDTDFSGRAEAPAFFWLQGNIGNGFNPKRVFEPGKTVWDQIQESACKNKIAETSERLNEFRGDFNLSATAMANYNKCPFIFFAENILRLNIPEPVDFDLGYRDLGSLLHYILENVVENNLGFELSNEKISKCIDQWTEENKFPVIDRNIWQEQKRKFYPFVQKFLETERTWRNKFPLTKTVGTELEFSTEIPTSTAPIKMRGRIDRVDTDGQGHFAVIDYKRSSSSLTSYGSWLKNKIYQPLLYTMALENGWTSLGKNHVSSGQFFVLKDGDRSKSYFVTEDAGTLYGVDDKARNKISLAEKIEMLEGMQEVIKSTAENIRLGKLLPNPSEEKLCNDCSWRYACRAKHLI